MDLAVGLAGISAGAVTTFALVAALYYRRLQKQMKKQSLQLATIEQLYNEVQRTTKTVDRNVIATIQSLVHALEARDTYTKGHSERVNRYSMAIGKELGLKPRELEILHDASLLHDIGKIGVYDRILLKPMHLTEEEFRMMQAHPDYAAEILKALPFLEEHIPLIQHHHERQDGSGYPLGLKGDQIPLGARIIQVADSWDAMTSDRPYRRRMPTAKAVEELKKGRGLQSDAECVDAFVSWLQTTGRIQISHETYLN